MALIFVIVSANIFIVAVFGYHLNSGTDIKAEINGIQDVTNILYGERGLILDKNGAVLAHDVTAYLLSANIDPDRVGANGEPAHIVDKEEGARIISEIINKPYDDVLGILNSDAKQVEFGFEGKAISASQKEQLENSGLKGLGFQEVLTRVYPGRDFASKLIGYTGYDDETESIKGMMGLEGKYNDYLTGVDGYESYQQDRDGYKLRSVEVRKRDSKNGKNIKLTLDTNIQYQLEDSLKGIVNDPNVKASAAWGIVVEAKTGRVLGWGEYPGLDPDNPNNTYEDGVSQWTYEPGSTMKTFSVASAIDTGKWDDAETFYSGAFYVGDSDGKAVRLSDPDNAIHTITNAGEINYGSIPYDYGYAISSNVMIAELMTNKLDYNVYMEYLRKLKFFSPLETEGISGYAGDSGADDVSVLGTITNAFGQGMTVTMAQMAQAYTSVMGDGSVIQPYFIDSITDPVTNEVLFQGQTKNLGAVYKPETAQHMRDLMRLVVTKGSARRFDIPEIEVIGKTGTAQMVVDGVYSPTQYIFSSALGFPYDDPEVIVYTAYIANYGHDVDYSAVHVNKVVKTAVNSLSLGQEKGNEVVTEVKPVKVDNYVNINANTAAETLKGKGMNPIIIGNGTQVISQFPTYGYEMITGERIMLYTGGTEITMPDMTGWSYKEVTSFWSLTGVSVEITGFGFTTTQSIPAGTVLTQDSVISVNLQ
ncbi:penicillin-binding protein [Erysipelothrix sp. HDW6C]|nr:penicillin-binding protein [Erysipelothrix sp. HDW6C]